MLKDQRTTALEHTFQWMQIPGLNNIILHENYTRYGQSKFTASNIFNREHDLPCIQCLQWQRLYQPCGQPATESPWCYTHTGRHSSSVNGHGSHKTPGKKREEKCSLLSQRLSWPIGEKQDMGRAVQKDRNSQNTWLLVVNKSVLSSWKQMWFYLGLLASPFTLLLQWHQSQSSDFMDPHPWRRIIHKGLFLYTLVLTPSVQWITCKIHAISAPSIPSTNGGIMDFPGSSGRL